MSEGGSEWRIMLIVLSLVLGCILVVLGILLVLSPGHPSPLRDENGKVLAGSVSEKGPR